MICFWIPRENFLTCNECICLSPFLLCLLCDVWRMHPLRELLQILQLRDSLEIITGCGQRFVRREHPDLSILQRRWPRFFWGGGDPDFANLLRRGVTQILPIFWGEESPKFCQSSEEGGLPDLPIFWGEGSSIFCQSSEGVHLDVAKY